MGMKIFKNFRRYTPEQPLFPDVEHVLYLQDETGRDWYQLQKEFNADTLKVAYDNESVIRSWAMDASMLFPVELSVSEVEASEGEQAGEALSLGEWVYLNGKIVKRSDVVQDWKVQAENQRQILTSAANNSISFWQTKMLAGKPLTDQQKMKLEAWLDYMDRLEEMDFSAVTDQSHFDSIDWPEEPRNVA